MVFQDVKIVLCQVSEPGNAGAICRLMKNMGLSELRLAAPKLQMEPDSKDAEQIRARAVHAWEIWENARIFDNLRDAVADCSIVVGTTRRRGSRRKNISMPPRTLAEWLFNRPDNKPAAIVFGNERTGLEDSELEICNFASHIPVFEGTKGPAGSQPSLNLSHAVQIYVYELFLAMESQLPVKGEWFSMDQVEVAQLVRSITDSLANLGFYKRPGREEQARFLHDLISRAGLTISEGQYLKDIFVKTAHLGSKHI